MLFNTSEINGLLFYEYAAGGLSSLLTLHFLNVKTVTLCLVILIVFVGRSFKNLVVIIIVACWFTKKFGLF